METILSQKFTYATITPFRDYCNLSEKPKSLNTFEIDEEEVDDHNGWDGLLKHSVFRRDAEGKTYELPEKLSYNKKRLNFFYDNTDVHEKFKIKFDF